ncbi:unnamed protein product [Moneuplotes crassus]|uniref:Uncharacterized protein n=1 Tax=Euplotes crassus TaxID=5936 RepID=A0AAD2D9Z0_EUPCR|nr:unnamed protein product [Moneuplotes crassus]
MIKLIWSLFTQHAIPSLLGLMYYFLLMVFLLFIYHYISYSMRRKDPSYQELFEKLDGFARPAILMFIMFLIFTYVAQNIEGFDQVLIKGGILSCVTIPLVYIYYSDPHRFLFL